MLTILICTHNRADLLAQAIESLNSAQRPHTWRIEILVAANACTDHTHQYLQNYLDAQSTNGAIPLRWFAEPKPGKSFAINSAITYVQDSNIVAFVDDDHRVDKQFLVEICCAADEHPEVSMFCGRILPDWDGSEPSWVHDEGPYKIYPLPIPRQDLGPTSRPVTEDTGPVPGGGNLFLRPSVFNVVGGFSTDLGPKGHDLGGGEDSAFIINALRHDQRLQYVPSILQYHYVDTERLKFPYLVKKAFQRSKSVKAIENSAEGIPLYMWRKLAEYLFRLLLPLGWSHLRFYLMRIAATLGEIQGFRQNTPEKSKIYRSHKAIRIAGGLTIASALTVISSGYQIFPHAWPALLAAVLFTTLLTAKSIQDFSHTGPSIPKSIKRSYLGYTVYALGRLTLVGFLLAFSLGIAGNIAYAALCLLFDLTYSPWLAVVAALLMIVSATALQFCQKLLWNPGLLIASMHYRASRFYGLWRLLSPSLIRGLYIAAASIFLLIIAASSMKLLEHHSELLIPLWAGLILYGSAIFWSCYQPEPIPQKANTSHRLPNIIMIGSDTLRADALQKGITPNIQKLAKMGTLFSQCYVPCARTAPSLVSLFTATWPQRHGIRDNFVSNDQTQLNTTGLAHWLSKKGYISAAISDWCGADLGKFSLGFEMLDLPCDQWNLKYFIRQGPKDLRLFLSLFMHNRLGRTTLPEIYYLGGVPQTSQLGKRGREKLSQLAAGKQPFLFNVFYSTTHPPFSSEYPWYTRFSDDNYKGESKFAMARLTDPFDILRRQGEPKDEFDLNQILSLYDGCVAQFDDEVGKIVDHIDKCGLTNNTIIVIYSDHGMEFFEHDTWGQGNSAIGEASPKIPFIIHTPHHTGGNTVSQVVRSIDIAPTIAELAGISPPEHIDGISLKALLDTPDMDLELAAFNETGIWVTDIPGLPNKHLRYPDLLELLTVPDIGTGTLAIKHEYVQRILAAKDTMIRKKDWKLVSQPTEDGKHLLLFNLKLDPECQNNIAEHHPDIVQELLTELRLWHNIDAMH